MAEIHVVHNDADVLIWTALVGFVGHVLAEYPCVSAWQFVGQVEYQVQIIDFNSPTVCLMTWEWDPFRCLMLIQLTLLVDGADCTTDQSLWKSEHIGNLFLCHPYIYQWHIHLAAIGHSNDSSFHNHAVLMLLKDALSLLPSMVRSLSSF